jgi:hypothetical protein
MNGWRRRKGKKAIFFIKLNEVRDRNKGRAA